MKNTGLGFGNACPNLPRTAIMFGNTHTTTGELLVGAKRGIDPSELIFLDHLLFIKTGG